MIMKDQMALPDTQYLMETDIQASENAEGPQWAWKLDHLSLQEKEGYCCEELSLSFHSPYWSSSYWNQRKAPVVKLQFIIQVSLWNRINLPLLLL